MTTFVLASTFLVLAMIYDIQFHTIPNGLVYGAAMLGAGLSLAAGLSGGFDYSVAFADSMAGFAACFGIMFLAWLVMGIGGGDVKMAAAVGALVGLNDGLSTIAFGYLVAGACTLVWMVVRTPIVPVFAERILGFVPGLFVGWALPAGKVQSGRLMKMEIPMAGFFALGFFLDSWLGPLI